MYRKLALKSVHNNKKIGIYFPCTIAYQMYTDRFLQTQSPENMCHEVKDQGYKENRATTSIIFIKPQKRHNPKRFGDTEFN